MFLQGLFRPVLWSRWDNWWRLTGIHWYWPLVTHVPTIVPIKRQTTYLPKQKLTTRDNKPLHLRGVLIYEIHDVRALLCETHDYDDTSHDFALVAISKVICDNNYSELLADSKKCREDLSTQLREELRHFGIKVIRLSLADFATGLSLLHMTDIADVITEAE